MCNCGTYFHPIARNRRSGTPVFGDPGSGLSRFRSPGRAGFWCFHLSRQGRVIVRVIVATPARHIHSTSPKPGALGAPVQGAISHRRGRRCHMSNSRCSASAALPSCLSALGCCSPSVFSLHRGVVKCLTVLFTPSPVPLVSIESTA